VEQKNSISVTFVTITLQRITDRRDTVAAAHPCPIVLLSNLHAHTVEIEAGFPTGVVCHYARQWHSKHSASVRTYVTSNMAIIVHLSNSRLSDSRLSLCGPR